MARRTRSRPLAGGSCPACRQQAQGSAFLQELNSGDESPGDVSYTQLVTHYDPRSP